MEDNSTPIIFKSYKVIWEIELYAGSPKDAAKMAQAIQQDPRSTANVFKVSAWEGKWHCYGEPEEIDLSETEDTCD